MSRVDKLFLDAGQQLRKPGVLGGVDRHADATLATEAEIASGPGPGIAERLDDVGQPGADGTAHVVAVQVPGDGADGDTRLRGDGRDSRFLLAGWHVARPTTGRAMAARPVVARRTYTIYHPPRFQHPAPRTRSNAFIHANYGAVSARGSASISLRKTWLSRRLAPPESLRSPVQARRLRPASRCASTGTRETCVFWASA